MSDISKIKVPNSDDPLKIMGDIRPWVYKTEKIGQTAFILDDKTTEHYILVIFQSGNDKYYYPCILPANTGEIPAGYYWFGYDNTTKACVYVNDSGHSANLQSLIVGNNNVTASAKVRYFCRGYVT